MLITRLIFVGFKKSYTNIYALKMYNKNQRLPSTVDIVLSNKGVGIKTILNMKNTECSIQIFLRKTVFI